MSMAQSLLLGVLQGVAEFLPISSSGHLVLLRNLMGLGTVPILYDVLLHVSTLIVVVIVFRRRIASIFASIWRWVGKAGFPEDRENLRIALYLVAATAVTAVVGLTLSRLEELFLGQPRIVPFLFLATAAILICSRFGKAERDYLGVGVAAVLLIGLAQGIGVLPGISRSGITISVALLCGLDRQRSGEFSFLLAVPAILGALALQLPEAGSLLAEVNPSALLVGFLASFAVGFASLLALLRIVRRGRLALFAIYLIPLSVASFILL